MKNYIYKIFAAFVVLAAFVSCKSSGQLSKENLIGGWHYSGVENGVNEDVWMTFSADNSFEMYQMIGEGAYWKYVGSYNLDEQTGVLYGRYSDMVPWAHDYKVSIKKDKLTLTAIDVPDYVVEYTRETTPDSVKNKALQATKSAGTSIVPFM